MGKVQYNNQSQCEGWIRKAHGMLDFHGMDAELFHRSLALLVKRGKAQVFGSEDQQGVKFF